MRILKIFGVLSRGELKISFWKGEEIHLLDSIGIKWTSFRTHTGVTLRDLNAFEHHTLFCFEHISLFKESRVHSKTLHENKLPHK